MAPFHHRALARARVCAVCRPGHPARQANRVPRGVRDPRTPLPRPHNAERGVEVLQAPLHAFGGVHAHVWRQFPANGFTTRTGVASGGARKRQEAAVAPPLHLLCRSDMAIAKATHIVELSSAGAATKSERPRFFLTASASGSTASAGKPRRGWLPRACGVGGEIRRLFAGISMMET
jgi:hypothetical protein